MAAGRGYRSAQIGVLTGDGLGVGLGDGLRVGILLLFPAGVGVASGFGAPGMGPWITLGSGGGMGAG